LKHLSPLNDLQTNVGKLRLTNVTNISKCSVIRRIKISGAIRGATITGNALRWKVHYAAGKNPQQNLTLSDPMSDVVRHYDFPVPDAISSSLTLSNPIFLSTAYSPAFIYFGRERSWWNTCNYPTVLKEENINRNIKSKTCAICWLQSVLHE
jgi:hypothetical protein